ncbi:MAG: HPF/RaiA family ribosome-associated protein [Candidatus Brocadiaceae bacterium]|nr:HPF/RaiA family ribosome-associated protein [Candidatus Brocadiaceae bacterium]
MIQPLQITSQNLELTESIRANIREHAENLDKYYSKIISCRIAVEALPNRSLYNVRINMTVPGKELMVNLSPNRDLYLAIRDAFHDARRILEDFGERQRSDARRPPRHEEPSHAHITSLFQDQGYGFLTTLDGREVYFHENSVQNHKFKQLTLGMEVRFAEEMGEKGPQATYVKVV